MQNSTGTKSSVAMLTISALAGDSETTAKPKAMAASGVLLAASWTCWGSLRR